jgi:hypothetical protein
MIDVETRASLQNEKPKLFAGNIPNVNLRCAPRSPGNLDRRSGFLSIILQYLLPDQGGCLSPSAS